MSTFINVAKKTWHCTTQVARDKWTRWGIHAPWCAGLLAIVLALFVWQMFSRETVYSKPGTDVYSQYIYQQAFINNEVSLDLPMTPIWKELPPWNLPLWNPYTYGGHTFIGDSQAALLYPPTWFVSYMRPNVAINVMMAFHTFLIGFGLYAWAAFRGLRPAAAFIGGVMAMLGGTYFMHVYAGHMSNLGSMAWAPFVFLGIDAWMRTHRIKWVVLAAAAAALQVYAGHVQYVYYTAIVAGLYSLIFFWKADRRMATVLGLLAIYPLAVVFSAAQLLPAYGAMGESVRAGGTTFEFASMFGLPPENLLTTLAPWIFGGSEKVVYWGRCYLWEMQLFMGVAGLVLAIYGIGTHLKSDRWRWAGLLALVFILALGANTPLYTLLYKTLPFYSSFRGASKFIFFIGLFCSLLAAVGINALFENKKPSVKWGGVWIGLGAVSSLIGLLITSKSLLGFWKSISSWTLNSGESFVPRDIFSRADGLMEAASSLSGYSLLIGGGLLILAGFLFIIVRRNALATWGLAVMVVAELFVFAYINLPSFKLGEIYGVQVQEFLQKNKGDFRTLNLAAPMAGMAWRSEGLWGNDPSVLKRYAEFMTFTQGGDPDKASQYVSFNRVDERLFGMLRGAVAFVPDGPSIKVTPFGGSNVLGRFTIISSYEVIKTRNEIFKALANPNFDLKQQIILESEPNPKPEPQGAEYTVRLLGGTTDQWTLEITCNRATMLVMTDAWSRDWRAVTLPGSVQTNYDILPANYVLRAIPLAAGRHLLRLEYVPWGFSSGKKITFAGIVLALCFLAFPSWRRHLRLEGVDDAVPERAAG